MTMTTTTFGSFVYVVILLISHCVVLAFKAPAPQKSSFAINSSPVHVIVNGLPGPMAMETAKACIDRGMNLIPFGFTGRSGKSTVAVVGKSSEVQVELVSGPGINPDAQSLLQQWKNQHPNLIVVDYTHPSATLTNLECYVATDCDFVMGTTGGEADKMQQILGEGQNFAVIAPNMAKQIVAVQATILEISKRFPKSFETYELTVTESHQSTKADTSGTAKALVSHMAVLTGQDFSFKDIVKLRDKDAQLSFGVPEESLGGHAFHTYRLTSPDKSVVFELKHNVCGRRVYAEGTADAVQFLANMRRSGEISPGTPAGGVKRLFNMIDVLESGSMI